MRPAALEAGVAYVPGPPFHVGDDGRNSMRLSFSHLTETELETAVERLAGVVRAAFAQGPSAVA
jgi:2-aminoadipate transaminase